MPGSFLPGCHCMCVGFLFFLPLQSNKVLFFFLTLGEGK
jgi:hypothetical protein